MNKYNKIFLDLDDVLLDTSNAVLKFHNIEPPDFRGKRQIHKIVNMSWHDFWGVLPYEFWANIPKMPWADVVVDTVVKHYGIENTFLLTSPIRTAACAGGKMDWCVKTYDHLSPNLIIGHPKWHLVDDKSLLIDDSYHNEKEFVDIGKRSSFYLFPSLQNSRHQLATLYRSNPNLAALDVMEAIITDVY